MVASANLGFPRIGARRELKAALERFWAAEITESDLVATGRTLRRDHWTLQAALGLDHVPSNDFSLYDHVLDMAMTVGAVPRRYRDALPGPAGLAAYFLMARGGAASGRAPARPGPGLAALPLTKWLDTNYHYVVPEFDASQEFQLESTKPLDEYREARALGLDTRPVLLGPVSFLLLGRSRDGSVDPLSLLDRLLPVYEALLGGLAAAGAKWVQLDEPCLVLDLSPPALRAVERAYGRLAPVAPGLRRLVATYFGGLDANLPLALRLPVDALHLDLVRAPQQLDPALAQAPEHLALSLGVVDGRNVWRTDLDRALLLLERACVRLGPDRVQVAPSCSLLHAPVDAELETALDPELRSWLAFAVQRLREVGVLTAALRGGRRAVEDALAASREAARTRRISPRTHDAAVRRRIAAISPDMRHRASPSAARRACQRTALQLPLLPTTTIGSFPQTPELRAARTKLRSGETTREAYEGLLAGEIERAIRVQETIGLDVLVHGECERGDMVEYFADQLNGFAPTQHGWVQSYGSRCVKPPILFGDVSRRGPMTVRWARLAQSLTPKPVKGMLTGPVTMTHWSFVRDDQPPAATCRQIALALRDEVADLEAAGLRVIQIDEPAFREGLPLRPETRPAYLAWAVEAFQLASAGLRDGTQLHTHMCYADAEDIIGAIADLDPDVLAIEASRSGMRLLEVFRRSRVPCEVGPGVYDVHSPRVPGAEEILARLQRALAVLPAERLWVNPDCGLKTRRWEEVQPALTAMVVAARRLRRSLAGAPDPRRAGEPAGPGTAEP
jgi:5-methyltetrahydropteroyltriglutamate--homocysteine methyltransferase